jgi:glucosamine--fructose-6-phosphate aminotransferase (isomerizing)
VHNGIIENYATIKTQLEAEGYVFVSQTDTEVLAHLIHSVQNRDDLTLENAVRQALTLVRGTFGLVVMSEKNPDQLVAARRGSALLLGVGETEYVIASDASAIVERTREVVYFDDDEMVVCERDGETGKYTWVVSDLHALQRTKTVEKIEMKLEELELCGYDHFMQREIFDQPNSLRNCMRGRLDMEGKRINLGGLKDCEEELIKARRIIICACGTSWHAALVGEYLIESLARLGVEVEYASEFRYRDPILTKGDDIVMVISQSGETADTLAAVREAKKNGCLTLGVVNTVGSTIARETDHGVYLHAGPEIGVASTKAFTAQVAVLTMIALHLGQVRGVISPDDMLKKMESLAAIPDQVAVALKTDQQVKDMSRVYRYASNFLFLGRGFNFPVALEAALKVKEVSYIHAEGYPSAEMKHGPIALIDKFMPVLFVAMRTDPMYEKIRSNIEEVSARGGSLIVVTDDTGECDFEDGKLNVEYVIKIPPTEDFLQPLLSVVPLQLLSYYIATLRGCDVDKPRNLAKSVCVE